MPRNPKRSSSAAPLAPVPAEILDQFVGQGPITAEELDAAVRRFKNAIIERALGGQPRGMAVIPASCGTTLISPGGCVRTSPSPPSAR